MDQLNDAIDELFPLPGGKMSISSTGSFDAKAFMGGSLDGLPPAFSSMDNDNAAVGLTAGGSGTIGSSTDFHSSMLDALPPAAAGFDYTQIDSAAAHTARATGVETGWSR
jgi:hypothetical protein